MIELHDSLLRQTRPPEPAGSFFHEFSVNLIKVLLEMSNLGEAIAPRIRCSEFVSFLLQDFYLSI